MTTPPTPPTEVTYDVTVVISVDCANGPLAAAFRGWDQITALQAPVVTVVHRHPAGGEPTEVDFEHYDRTSDPSWSHYEATGEFLTRPDDDDEPAEAGDHP